MYEDIKDVVDVLTKLTVYARIIAMKGTLIVRLMYVWMLLGVVSGFYGYLWALWWFYGGIIQWAVKYFVK